MVVRPGKERLFWLLSMLILAQVLTGCSSADDELDQGGQDGPSETEGGEMTKEEDFEAQSDSNNTDGQKWTNTTEIYPYVGPSPLVVSYTIHCPWFLEDNAQNVGGACFELPGDTKDINVTVEDDVSPDVAFYVMHWDSSGNPLGTSGFYCNKASVEPFVQSELVIDRDSRSGLGKFYMYPLGRQSYTPIYRANYGYNDAPRN